MAEAPVDATWDELYRQWAEARAISWKDADGPMRAARKRVARNTPDDWQWLAEALADEERKWFVALVFKLQTLPRRLLGANVPLEPLPNTGAGSTGFVTAEQTAE